MVSEAQPDSRLEHEADGDEGQHHGPPPRGGVRRLIASLTRLINLQYRIWMTQAKMVMMKIAISAGLFIGAAVFGVIGVIFLCIGLFHVLTDVVGIPLWAAFLIFGGFLAILAAALVLIATRMLTKKDQDEDEDQTDDQHGEGSK